MASFIPSLASMSNTDLLVNLAAMGVFVDTVSVNVVIQLYTGLIQIKTEHAVVVVLILFLFVVLSFSALIVPTTNNILEQKYKELHREVFDERKEDHASLSVEKLEDHVRICWVLAETGSPQFVKARSVISSTSTAISILSVVALMKATLSNPSTYYNHATANIGEAELPERALQNIYSSASNFIKNAGKKSPKNLKELLQKSISYKGLPEFDSNKVPSITSVEPPNCWTLPIVTLTSIAIALPNIDYHLRNRLLRSVAEGLTYARLIEIKTGMNKKVINVSNALDVIWVGIDLYGTWLDKNLQKMALEAKSSAESLQCLACSAEEIVIGFKTKLTGNLLEDPLNWPAKLIAANSMYRIT
ncbi:hypothetical protein ACH5RR_038487 [Cinchona calisaya]|uniref:Uncharacterized protein n=1 Tax=Cinchona calisaya TaxID=153742 RepID=A0ABD2XVF0_9GENT